MKIILSNYRYFISGGPERYLFSIKKMLENVNHNIIPFSVKSGLNASNDYEEWFMSPVDAGGATYFAESKKSFPTYCKIISRSFYSPEGFIKARRIAQSVKPDLVYSLHFLNKMSPSVIDGFKSMKVPVVVRLSDFGIMCPQAHFFCHGKVCEKCINGNFFHAVRNKCIFDTHAGSMIKACAWKFHRLIKVYDRIDAFICPTTFMRHKMIEAGFSEEKLFHVPTFIDSASVQPAYTDDGYILYFGRLSEEKGVETLLDAYVMLPEPKPKLLIIGDIETAPELTENPRYQLENICFKSFMKKDALFEAIRKSLLVVVPSVWYENMPNVLLESYALGKPVLASNIGSLREVVQPGKTGVFFNSGDADNLRNKLLELLANKKDLQEMGRTARVYVEQFHTPDKHLFDLQDIFSSPRQLPG